MLRKVSKTIKSWWLGLVREIFIVFNTFLSTELLYLISVFCIEIISQWHFFGVPCLKIFFPTINRAWPFKNGILDCLPKLETIFWLFFIFISMSNHNEKTLVWSYNQYILKCYSSLYTPLKSSSQLLVSPSTSRAVARGTWKGTQNQERRQD